MNPLVALLFVGVCSVWNQPQVMGHLDHTEIDEASGLVVLEDHLYHINDSGKTAKLFKTDLQGRLKSKIDIQGAKINDWEDMQMGPCGEERCLFIGDIGDNKRNRKSISIIAFREKDVLEGRKIRPLFTLDLRYPDKAHNSEAFVVDAQGNIFLFTKAKSPFEILGEETQVYRLPSSKYKVSEPRQSAMLEFWTHFSLDSVITGASLSPDGQRLALLSYSNLIELEFDSSRPELLSNPVKFSMTRVNQLPQPEAVAYLGSDIIVTSEAFGNMDPVFMRFSCQR